MKIIKQPNGPLIGQHPNPPALLAEPLGQWLQSVFKQKSSTHYPVDVDILLVPQENTLILLKN